MARIFSKINKRTRYKCFDTNIINLLQYYYLKQNNLDVGFTKKNKIRLISDVKNFEEQFSYLVKDPEFYKKTIQKGTERLTVDFCNIGNSAKNILKEINKIW